MPNRSHQNATSANRPRDWIAVFGLIGTLVLAGVALYQAHDAHVAASHAEDNTSAQINVYPNDIAGRKWLIISDQGEGPADFVRTWCIGKTQGRPWNKNFTPSTIIGISPSVTRRLTSHGEPDRIDPSWCLHDALKKSPGLDEIYLIIEYSTPWHERHYEDWDFTLNPTVKAWTQSDPAVPAAIYREDVVKWLDTLRAFGED